MFRQSINEIAPLAERAQTLVAAPKVDAVARLVGDGRCIETWQLELSGRVQAVGFRPFVYRLARALGLNGTVCNRLGTVEITVQGPVAALDTFRRRVIDDAPPLAVPAICKLEITHVRPYEDFRIEESGSGGEVRIVVPPDYFLCADCTAELDDPGNRRFRYPFINCTQCGPRYTLIRALPYDRANTSMAGFTMCRDCAAEYTDPGDRRFHAEPIACPVCGPRIRFERSDRDLRAEQDSALRHAVAELRSGHVLAVKGIGGYHLMCDAGNRDAVARLRIRKHRPDKPLAAMFPLAGDDGLAHVRECVVLSRAEAARLQSPARPIVLARKRRGIPIAANVAPGLDELGVFLPYSPLHQLLLDDFGAALVATSGNLSGEPVLTESSMASARLASVADAFLHHDRPIVRPADDAVYRRIAGRVRPLRLGRGVAPVEFESEWRQSEPVLCLGGHLKTTVALSWGARTVVSPHIGDMDSPRSLQVFEQVIGDLQALYGVQAARILCDAHPGYTTHRWARRQRALPVATVWHHRAHAAALAGEAGLPGPWLVFTWDGVGLGEDGTLWGGEALLGHCGQWRRVASLRPFRLPGGERAGREPWRSAAALLWETGRDWQGSEPATGLARGAWQAGLNCPRTSAAGRLFDAAAALVAGTYRTSFEAQGPMLLEALSRHTGDARSLPITEDGDGVLRSDWQALLEPLSDSRIGAAQRAADFHSSMAQLIVDQAIAVSRRFPVERIGLAGGVFQNRLLTGQARDRLRAAGFEVHLNRLLPCNDAALSFGQAAEWAARRQERQA